MSGEVVAALISSVSVVLAGIAGYVFTKRAEREAEWRREKLERYKALAASLSDIIDGAGTPEGQREYARCCNNVHLFAPQTVLAALHAFQDEIGASNPSKSLVRHDEPLAALFLEIRRDLRLRPRDKRGMFRVRLWTAGTTSERRRSASTP